MVKSVENRPAGTWKGLQNTEAPLGLADGYLLEATDYIIRKASTLAQRPGFQPYTTRGFINKVNSGISKWPIIAMFTKQLTNGAESVMGVGVNPANQSHYFLDETGPDANNLRTLTTYRRNYWGYGGFVPNATTSFNTYDDTLGMVMGDPRVVNGIYTSQNTAANLLQAPVTLTDFDPVLNQYQASYDIYSTPLGIPSMAGLSYTQTYATAPTNNYASSQGISTWAYRACFKLGGFFGAPSPDLYVQTTQFNKITAITYDSTNVRFSFAVVAHGLNVGDYVEFIDIAGNTGGTTPNKGWTVTTVTDANNFTVQMSGVNSAIAGTNFSYNWRRPVNTTVTLTRPKEQGWTNSYLNATHGQSLDVARSNGSEFYTRSVYQDGEFYLYRTDTVTTTLNVPAINPGDEQLLLSNVSAKFQQGTSLKNGWTANDTNMTLTFTDNLPDNALGANLYTNLSAEGIGQANQMPPVARLHEDYQNYHWWANVNEASVLSFRFTGTITGRFFIGVKTQTVRGTPTTNWYCFEAKTAESITNLEILNTDAGTLGQSLCRVINSNPMVPLKARYVTGFNDSPGRVEIVALDYQAVDLTLASDYIGGLANTPAANYLDTSMSINTGPVDLTHVYPAAKSVAVVPLMKNCVQAATLLENRIYYSKLQQPYATPRVNFIDVPKGTQIIGLRATSQNLFVVTTDALWAVTGTSSSNWTLLKKDNSFRAWSQGAINLIRDNLVVLTDQGIQVYGSGQTISLDINNLIQPIREQVKQSSVMWDNTYATEPFINSAVDATTNEYLLMIPKDDGSANWLLRYNLDTTTWTVTDRDITAGMLYTNNDFNRMLYAERRFGHVILERRSTDKFLNTDEMLQTPTNGIGAQLQLSDGSFTYRGSLVAPVYDDVNGFIRKNDFVVTVEYKPDGTIYRTRWTRLLGVTKDSFGWLFNTEDAVPLENTGFRYTDWNKTEPTTVVRYLAFNIQSRAGMVTFRGGDANTQKRFGEVLVHFFGEGVRELSLETQTDDRKNEIITQVTRDCPSDGWGKTPWGQFAWGQETVNGEPTMRTYLPLEHSVSRTLRVTFENTGFNQPVHIQGVGVLYNVISQRTVR